MIQTVPNFLSAFRTPAKATAKICSLLFCASLSIAAAAQTHTTKAPGNWNSPSTWEGGNVPGATIDAGKTVTVKHAVLFNLSSDLTINGTLNIQGDTLRFNASYDKKITVASSGCLLVKKGGFLQTVSTNKSEMLVSGGRVVLENAVMLISKNVKATAGAKRTYKNSTLIVGEKYEVEGSSGNRSIDTVWNAYVEAGKNGSGIEYKDYATLRVSNATMIAARKDFSVKNNAEVLALPNAAGNFGFDLLKAEEHLENDGNWDARIDAYCVGKDVKGSSPSAIDFTRDEDCNEIIQTGELPEMSFANPVLKSGTANKQGAVYRFANVTTGVDAEIVLKKFSRNDIVMQSVDLSGMGWEKAFQPQFGLNGLVAPYQSWYVDFEMNFYKAGTNVRQKMSKMVFTALDVDGDGRSIAEYATFANPSSTEYSPVTVLGNGDVDILDAIADAGTLNSVVGTVQNFTNIDTGATQVMATFTYLNKDKITFRYGARSGALSSNGAGLRLNSLWAKPFSLDPWITLPVNFAGFSALHDKGNAVLNWQVEGAEKLSHFVVQRSTDGKTYADVATVFAGTASHNTYTDKAVSSPTGVVYYRIVSVDNTKEIRLSPVKTIRLNGETKQALAITAFPNPAVNEVRLTLPAAWQTKAVTLDVYTANGVLVKRMKTASASQTESLFLSGLEKGTYVVKAACGEEVATQRILKN